MAMRCESCDKGVMYGHNVSHAKNRTRKVFKPNLHQVRVKLGGITKQMKLCVKCSRMYKKVAAMQNEVKATEEVAAPAAL